MKHRKTWMALLLCAALLLSGCAGKQEDADIPKGTELRLSDV